MKVKTALYSLCRVVALEAESNPEFDARLRKALGLDDVEQDVNANRRHRRTKAVLDPVATVRDGGGEGDLREQLAGLTIEQLKDVIAEYSMDSDKLAMKWKDAGRLIERIVEVSSRRAKKGDAFRDFGSH